MKNNSLDSSYEFFQELPQIDYLTDIEIQDEYEKTSDYSIRGLSDEQVSLLALDSLSEARRNQTLQRQALKTQAQNFQN